MKSLISQAYIIFYSFWKAFLERGFWQMSQMTFVAIVDEYEDWRKGLIKSPYLDAQKIIKHGPYVHCANYYQPIRARPFNQVLKTIRPNTALNFVDVGAGTAKSFFIVAEHGFKNIRGVELVPRLVDVAKKNIEKFKGNYPEVRFEVVCEDVLNTEFREGDGVFLMNDPFYGEAFDHFVDKILRHHQQVSHEILLIYKNNGARKMASLDKIKAIAEYRELPVSSNYYEIYRLPPRPANNSTHHKAEPISR